METQKLNDLNARREKIIQRIACLTPEQFERLLTLLQQEQGSALSDPTQKQTSFLLFQS
jgi:hypothetical protein